MMQKTPETNKLLQRYYASLESRIGYRLLLNGTRHFGYYPSNKSWPVPIGRALRAMEDQLYDALQLTSGQVLDAGCGVGHVAMHLARKGLDVQAIDVVQRHVQWAQKNVRRAGLAGKVAVELGDYHDLSRFADGQFDGAYTMETLVHATDPRKALREFYRVLRPGARIVHHEYDHVEVSSISDKDKKSMVNINKYAAMPANQMFDQGVLEQLLRDVGFVDVELRDISQHVEPLFWLFYVLAYVPYLVVSFFGLQPWFINTVTAVELYKRAKNGMYRYVVVTARKPANESDTGSLRQRTV